MPGARYDRTQSRSRIREWLPRIGPVRGKFGLWQGARAGCGALQQRLARQGPAVIAGVAEVALETARQQVARRRDNLRAYERVEWARAELEGWLIQQAYEGMLCAMEAARDSGLRCVQAKTAIAELAESVLRRICRVIGGGTFSRSSPFGYWLEDVRALGFLRPPWGLAYDRLFAV